MILFLCSDKAGFITGENWTQTISVKISNDGDNFEDLIEAKQYTFDPDTGNEVQMHFDEIKTRYVQLVFTENSGAGGGQVAEFEIYSK